MKNYNYFLVLLLSLNIMPLSSCSSEDIFLYDNASILFGERNDNGNTNNAFYGNEWGLDQFYQSCLPTYRNRRMGDVPYVEISDYFAALHGSLPSLFPSVVSPEIENNFFEFSFNNGTKCVFDYENNVIKIVDASALLSHVFSLNNGYGPDYCLVGLDESLIGSSKTSIIGENNDIETYDFSNYCFKLEKANGNIYAPFDVLNQIFLKDLNISITYTGVDYVVDQCRTKDFEMYLNTNEGLFDLIRGNYSFRCHKLKADREHKEKFRYCFHIDKGTLSEYYLWYILYEDGTGSIFTSHDKEFQGYISNSLTEISTDRTLFWRIDGQILKINEMDISNIAVSTVNNDKVDSTYYVRLDKNNTRFKQIKRNKKMAEFNYDLLCFQLDYIYGLQEDKGFENGNSYLQQIGLKKDLLSIDPAVYNNSLEKLLINYLDDGHTSLLSPSIYCLDSSYSFAEFIIENGVGERTKNLNDVYALYFEDYFRYYGNYTSVVPYNTVYSNIDGCTLDGKDATCATINISSVSQDIFFNLNLAFDKIREIGTIKDIVFDLSANMGGLVAVIPVLAAYFTNDPHLLTYDTIKNRYVDYHYKVDLNKDGVFGGDDDSYCNQYSFFIITSQITFSAANELAVIAKDCGIKIIGQQSGGGSCPSMLLSDACGSLYTYSSYINYCMVSGDKMVNNDSGVPVDYKTSIRERLPNHMAAIIDKIGK